MQEFLFFLPLLRSSGKTPQKQLRRENRSVAFVGLTRGGWPRPNCFCGRWSCVSFALTRSVLIWCTGLTPSSAGDNTGTRHFQTVRGGRGRMDVGTLGRPVTWLACDAPLGSPRRGASMPGSCVQVGARAYHVQWTWSSPGKSNTRTSPLMPDAEVCTAATAKPGTNPTVESPANRPRHCTSVPPRHMPLRWSPPLLLFW